MYHPVQSLVRPWSCLHDMSRIFIFLPSCTLILSPPHFLHRPARWADTIAPQSPPLTAGAAPPLPSLAAWPLPHLSLSMQIESLSRAEAKISVMSSSVWRGWWPQALSPLYGELELSILSTRTGTRQRRRSQLVISAVILLDLIATSGGQPVEVMSSVRWRRWASCSVGRRDRGELCMAEGNEIGGELCT